LRAHFSASSTSIRVKQLNRLSSRSVRASAASTTCSAVSLARTHGRRRLHDAKISQFACRNFAHG
jgi:hypothetical protein